MRFDHASDVTLFDSESLLHPTIIMVMAQTGNKSRARAPRAALRGTRNLTLKDTAIDLANSNATGLPSLPIELLFEITDYFAKVLPTTPAEELYTYPSPRTHLDRRDVLVALSQTCRAMRENTLPILWRDIQAFASTTSISTKSWRVRRREWRRAVSKELDRQCFAIFRAPNIAPYVETVTVALTDFATDGLPLFAHVLSLLPNLKTLHIVHLAYDCYNLLNVFDKLRLPTVKTMVLPVVPLSAGALLKSCPNVEHFVCNTQSDAAHSRRMDSSFLVLVRDSWPRLRSLRGFPIAEADEMASLLARCTQLEHLWIRIENTTDLVSDPQDQTLRYPTIISHLRGAHFLRSVRIDFRSTSVDVILATLTAVKPMLSGPLLLREPRLDVYLPPILLEDAITRIRAVLPPDSRAQVTTP
ncbi:uncharacterized protein SCHCODRAFT_01169598 [Schizophyllum commune H4-8]|nr:uncharacterized protein SCHCODRAFT_01169598 [Schizophyllum commune H4-8]KAI5895097.1 hypothetical protein SCHCODRAFT_01169598 [Schizophyllum commune H4-8]